MKSKDALSLFPLFFIVACNYLAQIPYVIHQYHGHSNPYGALLLLATLVWFVLGCLLLQKRKKLGYILLLTFLLVQVIFYFYNEVILSFYGYGMFYHFTHSKDWILWMVFLIGDINFFGACFYGYYLIRRKKA